MGIVHPHGLRGELKVVLHHPESGLDWRGKLVTLRARDGRPDARADAKARVIAFRRAGALAFIRLDGVDDRGAAERLDGLEAALARADLPELGDDEVYLGDLIGLRVVEGERDVGVVSDVRVYPAASCVVIASDTGELELPVHEPYVVEVDLRDGLLRVAHLDDLVSSSTPDDGREDG
jgi:16S rRNA processing protein RimM